MSFTPSELAQFFLNFEDSLPTSAALQALAPTIKKQSISGKDLSEWGRSLRIAPESRNLVKSDVLNQILGRDPCVRDTVLFEFCNLRPRAISAPDGGDSGAGGNSESALLYNLRNNRPLCLYGEPMRMLANEASAVLVSVSSKNPQIPELIKLGRTAERRVTTIGRGGCPNIAANVFLSHPAEKVLLAISRKHMVIDFRHSDDELDGRWWMRDTSQEGIWVNGERVVRSVGEEFFEEEFSERKLRDGDSIVLGGETNVFKDAFQYLFRIL